MLGRSPKVLAIATEAETADLESAQGFLERFLERPADRHRLADAFHLGRQVGVGLGEFLEGESRHLRDHVVDRRLETGLRLAGDIVGQFVEPVADGQLGRDLGDGEAGRLGGQRAGTAHTGIHLDDDHPAVVGMDRELDIRAARLDADLADHGQRGVAHVLVFFVGQRLRRGHRDRVARVDAHGIEVLDRADDHDVVVLVAHHLHLVLFPAEHGFFEQHLVDRRRGQPPGYLIAEILHVVGDARTGPAQREAGTHDAGQADLLHHPSRIFQVPDGLAAAHAQADLLHGRLELVALLRLGDHLGRGADHLAVELLEHAVPGEVHGQVQAGLPAQRRQQGVGPFLFDDLGHDFPGERLDVGAVGRRGIGHDRGRDSS